jgi:hypothetical protein
VKTGLNRDIEGIGEGQWHRGVAIVSISEKSAMGFRLREG